MHPHRAAEIAYHHLGGLTLQGFDKRAHAKRAPNWPGHTWPEYLWVDIEVAHLHQLHASLAQEIDKRGDLIFTVDQAGKTEQID